MLHVPATVEEQLILKAIKEECPWENLPKRLQSTLNSKDDWHRKIIEHCIKKRLPWNTSFARKVSKEAEYYEEMMRYLRKNLALFPYHLAEYVCRVMRLSSFRYYCDMIFEVMKNEQPYDSIPNFSAADALRLTGIGRNEFIDIMNKCKSKKIMWKLNKSIAKELLPSHPVDFKIDPWWGVGLVNFTLEEFKKLSEEEMATIDKICKEEANAYVLFDPEIIKGLYRRGLIYIDVPVYADDRFKVSRLEGFISNREQAYEDPIEELLYAVFVVSSENSTVAELASTLQADLSQLQAAASFVCRLGWAEKVIDPASILQESLVPGISSATLGDDEINTSSTNMASDGSAFRQGDVARTDNHDAHVAFVVDANITSYLMMGSVSPGLKSHAVTLYEAGKLGYASIADLCRDLGTLEGTKFEGELQEFANHAFSLRCILECLSSGGIVSEDLDNSVVVRSSNNEGNNNLSATVSEEDNLSSGTLKSDISIHDNESSVSAHDNESSVSTEGSSIKTETHKTRKYRVDILRCESLASLSAATLERLLLRDYDIVVSMVPLPQSSVLPGPKGPVHFGPPSHSSMTPWLKVALYSALGNGPLSVVLMKGQCLRLLPAPLAGCEKALIWSWDGSTVGGLGGKFQGNLVKGSILLHCLNAILKYSAVLVQPLTRYDLDDRGNITTMDVPLPLKNSDGSIADIGKELDLSAEESSKLNSMLIDMAEKIDFWTIGYIRLLRLFKDKESERFLPDDQKYEWVLLSVEFGVPLFSPKLCNHICKRVVHSELLQSNLKTEHHESMQELRKRLRDVCSKYNATGPTARLLYNREQPKESSKNLMTYASGRWNPLADPSSPISGAMGEHQRMKLANRKRCMTEVLSFDGNILRSYAMAPVYEAATRVVEESPNISSGKVDSKVESDDMDSRDVIHPGVNLLFDGSEVKPFDIGACLQARQPVSLIAEASAASSAIK